MERRRMKGVIERLVVHRVAGAAVLIGCVALLCVVWSLTLQEIEHRNGTAWPIQLIDAIDAPAPWDASTVERSAEIWLAATRFAFIPQGIEFLGLWGQPDVRPGSLQKRAFQFVIAAAIGLTAILAAFLLLRRPSSVGGDCTALLPIWLAWHGLWIAGMVFEVPRAWAWEHARMPIVGSIGLHVITMCVVAAVAARWRREQSLWQRTVVLGLVTLWLMLFAFPYQFDALVPSGAR